MFQSKTNHSVDANNKYNVPCQLWHMASQVSIISLHMVVELHERLTLSSRLFLQIVCKPFTLQYFKVSVPIINNATHNVYRLNLSSPLSTLTTLVPLERPRRHPLRSSALPDIDTLQIGALVIWTPLSPVCAGWNVILRLEDNEMPHPLPNWVWHFSTANFFFQFFKREFWKKF